MAWPSEDAGHHILPLVMMHPSAGGDAAANGVFTSGRLSMERARVDGLIRTPSDKLPA